MLKFFSFCCFIDKISKEDLVFALKLLLSSLDYYVKSYEIIIYTNFDIDVNHKNVIIRNYYDNDIIKYCDGDTPFDRWLNLSFNKINIYKDLYDEYNENYIWIDLDTPVMSDISYLENVDNFFIEVGGDIKGEKSPIIHDYFYIDRSRSICGCAWKLNINLYNSLMETLNELNKQNLKIAYDFQGLATYYLYSKLNGQLNENGINVLGLNYKMNTMNGLAIWSDDNDQNYYCNIDGLNKLYFDNNTLKTRIYPGKEIHFVGFTFITLNENKNSEIFKELFNHLLTF